MRGMKDPRLQLMMAGAYLLVGVFLVAISGPEVLSRRLWATKFWAEEATLAPVMWFVIGLAFIACKLAGLRADEVRLTHYRHGRF